jgi:putative iron-only hydrogenase system regulator
MAHFFVIGENLKARNITMEKRVAIIGIIVEKDGQVERLNELLHEYAEYIIGRMGVPHRERGISVISVAMDAPQDVISALGGKIGRLSGISSKTLYSAS